MTSQRVFELHSFVVRFAGGPEAAGDDDWLSAVPWQEDPSRSASVLQFPAVESPHEGAVWVGVDEMTGCPCRAGSQHDAVAGFAVIKRRLGLALSMATADVAGVLVNGLPALRFTVLSPQDSVVLTTGVHSYVTQRIRPYVGAPVEEMIGTKCPFCKLSASADTRIATCRCGVIYHHETADSHPAVREEDRLNCLSEVRACLSCGRPVTLEESLVWDPLTLCPQAE